MSDTTTPRGTAVAMFPSHDRAEAAIHTLQESGFDMKKLSIIGKDYQTEENVVGYYNAGDRMQVWGKTGAFWGGLWGILFGNAFFFIPGIGPLLIAGPLVAMIIAGLEGAVVVGGLSALGAALASIGVPEDSIVSYESKLKAGEFLLVVHGSTAEIERARGSLKEDELTVHAVDPEFV